MNLTRQLTRQPGFTAVVVLTLAITIGIATTVFSLFDAVFLRPFPYPNAQQLVRVRTYKPQMGSSTSDASVYDFWDWQKLNASFTGLAAYSSFTSDLTGSGEAQVVRTTSTSPALFTLLDVRPMLGRTFTDAENVFHGDVRKVVVSYGFWRRQFAGDRNALNRVIRLGGESYTVIGVMPPQFDYPDRTQLWTPLMAMYSANADPWWKLRDIRVNAVVGRLKPGHTASQAQLDLDHAMAGLARQYPATNTGVHARVIGLREAESGEVRGYVLLVSCSVLLLLAIGCVNVANLFIARASAREREFALRGALGAGAWHIGKQLAGESLVYGVLGSALGIAVASFAIRVLAGLLPIELPGWMSLHLDWRVLGFSILVSVATAFIFGLAPLIGRTCIDVNGVLKHGSRGSSAGRSTASQTRRALVILEVALSLLLLIGSGLMVRSFQKLMTVNTGVKTDHLLVVAVTRYLPNASAVEQVKGYSKEYQRVCQKLAQLPGVITVGAGDDLPYLDQPEKRNSAELFTKARSTRDLAYRGPAASSDVMPGYFQALGIPLLAGRDFTETDGLDRPPVAILSQYTAETFFPGRSPLGEQIRWGNNDTYNPWSTVIGVAGNTKWNPAERQRNIEVYWSAFQYPPSQINLLIRTAAAPHALGEAVRQVIHNVSPSLAIIQSKSMDAIVDETVWQHRLWSYALELFALLALLLTAVGLYGVMSYLVSQSTREIGIRMAIGSTSNAVLAMVLKQGMRLVACGSVIGLMGAVATHRLLTSLLYGVSDTDPVTYVCVTMLLIAIRLAACAVPAWRAARVDPVVALREG